MLIRLNLGLYSWVFASQFSSFGGSMVRALDYVRDAQMVRVRASAAHFYFFQKFALLFIIETMLRSKWE